LQYWKKTTEKLDFLSYYSCEEVPEESVDFKTDYSLYDGFSVDLKTFVHHKRKNWRNNFNTIWLMNFYLKDNHEKVTKLISGRIEY
jgi:hypothetical protein